MIARYLRIQLLISGLLNLAHIIVGYSGGWTATVVTKLQDPNETVLKHTISLFEASWIGSTLIISIVIACALTGLLSMYMGRKTWICLGSAINLVSYMILTFATSYEIILTGRAILGFGLSIVSIMDMVYIGEIASPNIRGIIFTLTGVFHAFGNLLVYAVGGFLPYKALGYAILPISAIHFIGCFFIPESPVYYVIKGDEDSAKSTLCLLGRDKDVDNELKKITDIVKQQTESNSNWKTLFTVKSNRDALTINLILFVIQEVNGMVYILYFVTTIFQEAGSSVDPIIATIIVGVTNLLGTLVAPPFIDKAGRKLLLFWSLAGCTISMLVAAVYFYLSVLDNQLIASVRWLPLAALILMSISFCVGLNVVPNTLTGEMFHPTLRGIGTSICVTLAWTGALISIVTYTYITERYGSHVVFFICAIINTIGLIFTKIFVPETKGLSLSEIEKIMTEKKS